MALITNISVTSTINYVYRLINHIFSVYVTHQKYYYDQLLGRDPQFGNLLDRENSINK